MTSIIAAIVEFVPPGALCRRYYILQWRKDRHLTKNVAVLVTARNQWGATSVMAIEIGVAPKPARLEVSTVNADWRM